jgi:hypothetical protein
MTTTNFQLRIYGFYGFMTTTNFQLRIYGFYGFMTTTNFSYKFTNLTNLRIYDDYEFANL